MKISRRFLKASHIKSRLPFSPPVDDGGFTVLFGADIGCESKIK